MTKKTVLLLSCLMIILIGFYTYMYFRPITNVINVSNVDKMVITNFVEDKSFTTTDRVLIEDIADKMNHLTSSRTKFNYLAVPDIVIYAYSENGDKICAFYLYGFNGNEYYCYYEKNGGRGSPKYLIDGAELFNLAESYIR